MSISLQTIDLGGADGEEEGRGEGSQQEDLWTVDSWDEGESTTTTTTTPSKDRRSSSSSSSSSSSKSSFLLLSTLLRFYSEGKTVALALAFSRTLLLVTSKKGYFWSTGASFHHHNSLKSLPLCRCHFPTPNASMGRAIHRNTLSSSARRPSSLCLLSALLLPSFFEQSGNEFYQEFLVSLLLGCWKTNGPEETACGCQFTGSTDGNLILRLLVSCLKEKRRSYLVVKILELLQVGASYVDHVRQERKISSSSSSSFYCSVGRSSMPARGADDLPLEEVRLENEDKNEREIVNQLSMSGFLSGVMRGYLPDGDTLLVAALRPCYTSRWGWRTEPDLTAIEALLHYGASPSQIPLSLNEHPVLVACYSIRRDLFRTTTTAGKKEKDQSQKKTTSAGSVSAARVDPELFHLLVNRCLEEREYASRAPSAALERGEDRAKRRLEESEELTHPLRVKNSFGLSVPFFFVHTVRANLMDELLSSYVRPSTSPTASKSSSGRSSSCGVFSFKELGARNESLFFNAVHPSYTQSEATIEEKCESFEGLLKFASNHLSQSDLLWCLTEQRGISGKTVEEFAGLNSPSKGTRQVPAGRESGEPEEEVAELDSFSMISRGGDSEENEKAFESLVPLPLRNVLERWIRQLTALD